MANLESNPAIGTMTINRTWLVTNFASNLPKAQKVQSDWTMVLFRKLVEFGYETTLTYYREEYEIHVREDIDDDVILHVTISLEDTGDEHPELEGDYLVTRKAHVFESEYFNFG